MGTLRWVQGMGTLRWVQEDVEVGAGNGGAGGRILRWVQGDVH